MQHQSAVECSHGERLRRLRAKLQIEWVDLAKRLNLSTSMCFQVAKGTKNLSDLALFRLEEAERAAGLAEGPGVTLACRESPAPYVTKRDSKHLDILEIRKRISQLEEQLAALKRLVEEDVSP